NAPGQRRVCSVGVPLAGRGTGSLICMAYKIVDPAAVAAAPGPHPAASPFDKPVSEALGINAFEVYTVESTRQLRAGSSGLTFVAICGLPQCRTLAGENPQRSR